MLSKNIKETAEISRILLNRILKDKKHIAGATVVGLSGDLGAGKTAFIKTAAKHLGIKHKVNSPTFTIIKKYPLESKKYKFFFHLDAYRLKNEKELLHLGWKDIIADREHLVFIEWPERVRKIIPRNAKFVYISADKKGLRNFKLK